MVGHSEYGDQISADMDKISDTSVVRLQVSFEIIKCFWVGYGDELGPELNEDVKLGRVRRSLKGLTAILK